MIYDLKQLRCFVANEDGVQAGSPLAAGFAARELIPAAHKVALADIEEGEPVVRYGATTGYAARRLEKDAWVHEGNIRLPGWVPSPRQAAAESTECLDPVNGSHGKA